MRTLHAGELVLEPQAAAHAPAMFAVLSDPALYEFENEPPESEAWLAERFRRLESRRSPDGRELWLNWVVRMPAGEPAGYVQATVRPGEIAQVAYVFGSRHWGRGHATASVRAMLAEVRREHGVAEFFATLKRANERSRRLLERLGFAPVDGAPAHRLAPGPGEMLMRRAADAPGLEP
jgi:RimJ/RimL family protein N-acetyltransferase